MLPRQGKGLRKGLHSLRQLHDKDAALHGSPLLGLKAKQTYPSKSAKGEHVKATISIVMTRNHEARFSSVEDYRNKAQSFIPVGPPQFHMIIDDVIRIPLTTEAAESIFAYMHEKTVTAKYPSGAEIYSASDRIPDPPEEQKDDEDEDDSSDFSVTDDAGDGVGQL